MREIKRQVGQQKLVRMVAQFGGEHLLRCSLLGQSRRDFRIVALQATRSLPVWIQGGAKVDKMQGNVPSLGILKTLV